MKKSFSAKDVNFKIAKGKLDIFGNMFHDHYEIYLLINGEVEFINSKVRKRLLPFEIVIIPPGEFHQFCVKGNPDLYERCIIDIYPSFMEEKLLREAFEGKIFLKVPENNRIIGNFKYLSQNIENEDFSYILPAVATDIVFLIKQISEEKDNGESSLNPLSEEIMKYINENYLRDVSLNEIADKFFISVSGVSHIFKKNFGISIKKYMTDKRMNEARIYLQNGSTPQDTSEICGFDNYSTFYRSYVKQFGVAPSETYKKAKQKTFA